MKAKYTITLVVLFAAVLSFVVFVVMKDGNGVEDLEVAKKHIEEVKGKIEGIKEATKKVADLGVVDEEVYMDEIEVKIASGNPYRQQEAIEALVDIGDEASIRQIEALAKDDTPSVVNRALRALGELDSDSSIPLIEEVFEDNRIRQDGHGESIRINAVMALGEIGSEASVDMLGKELGRRNVSFGFHVVEALEKIDSENSLPYLEKYGTFLEDNLAKLPGAEEIGEYRYVWEQAVERNKEAINSIRGGL